MSAPQRYRSGAYGAMVADDNGPWVRWSDVAPGNRLIEALHSFLDSVKPSTKNENAGFVDMRDVYDLRGLLVEADASLSKEPR